MDAVPWTDVVPRGGGGGGGGDGDGDEEPHGQETICCKCLEQNREDKGQHIMCNNWGTKGKRIHWGCYHIHAIITMTTQYGLAAICTRSALRILKVWLDHHLNEVFTPTPPAVALALGDIV